jgi:predicted TIM-barrel fold metal-dependent hydrolase
VVPESGPIEDEDDMSLTDQAAPAPAGTTLDIATLGAIDCDVHPRAPRRADLLPYLDAYWREIFVSREIEHIDLMSYPEGARPRRHAQGPVSDAADLAARLLDPLRLKAAILNVVSGSAHAFYDPYLAAAVCEATNRWLVAEWLDKDPRLRASLLVPFQHPEAAVAEIERYAGDKRFVQILTISMGEHPLGRRVHWPIYEATHRHGFALAVHLGSNYRHAPTQSGFPSYLVEENVAQSTAFANQVGSFVAEGVFSHYPEMKVVLTESGVTWMPGLMWRMSKDWRGARVEVPWVKEKPADVMRRHFRMTTQPFDAPGDAAVGARAIEHLGSEDMLLFSTDFPHDHRMDVSKWPSNLPAALATRFAVDNVRATYSRLEV